MSTRSGAPVVPSHRNWRNGCERRRNRRPPRAGASPSSRAPLQKLRKTIRSIVPEVEECFSYGIPAFRYQRRIIAGFQVTSKGCSYYPFSGTTLNTLAGDLEGYSSTKSALHFNPDKPLPAALVRKLLQARIAEGQR
ncbi:MAG TPA: DUF1801 domain-containing protein [Bryobacteraceae bacterium]|nr:DUF1801 domain-containing protein [Bryobacteraceae bacterium]